MSSAKRLWFIGVLPPPVNGMSTVSQRVLDELQQSVEVRRLPVHHRGALSRLWPLQRQIELFARTAKLAVAARSGEGVYFCLDAGSGQIGSCLIALVARMKRLRTYVHHHVFSYVDRPTPLARAFFRLAGRDAVHIALCSCMAERLREQYGASVRVSVLSNRNLIAPPDRRYSAPSALSAVGFLSNITAEKGITDFLRTAELVQSHRPDIRFVIAGPARTKEVELEVAKFVEASPENRRYVGPVYGDEKEAFFSEIDLLLFPTKYKNEAEPLTIYECLERSVPVLATDRGCIRSQIAEACVAGAERDFAPWAAEAILEASSRPAQLTEWLKASPDSPKAGISDVFGL